MSEINKSQVDIKDLNIKSESLTDRFENIENKLGLKDKSDLLSDDIRGTYFKIKNQARDGKNNNLENEYNNILSNYSKLAERDFSSKQEYLEAGKQLLFDLGNLKTNTGKDLKDVEIEGSLFETLGAFKDGSINAIGKIKEELESTIKMLVSPDQWDNILLALGKALMNPIDTMEGLIDGISEEMSDIGRDINLIREKSTKTGFVIEMSEYIPMIAIPAFIEIIGPGKFLKLLKIDIKPELLQKIENSKYNGKLGVSDNIVENNAKLVDKDRIEEAEKLLGKIDNNKKQAILDSHYTGKGGIGNYSQEELKYKSQILKEAGFNLEERRILMENAITGQYKTIDDYKSRIAESNIKNKELPVFNIDNIKMTMQDISQYFEGMLAKDFKRMESLTELDGVITKIKSLTNLGNVYGNRMSDMERTIYKLSLNKIVRKIEGSIDSYSRQGLRDGVSSQRNGGIIVTMKLRKILQDNEVGIRDIVHKLENGAFKKY